MNTPAKVASGSTTIVKTCLYSKAIVSTFRASVSLLLFYNTSIMQKLMDYLQLFNVS